LAAFRSSDLEIARGATAPALATLVTELEEGRRRRISGVTIADLLPREPREQREQPRETGTTDLPAANRGDAPTPRPRPPLTAGPPAPPPAPPAPRAFPPPGAARARPPVAGAVRPGPAAPALAVVCPHAGWEYSGALAGRLAAAVDVPPRLLVLAPNHTGRG